MESGWQVTGAGLVTAAGDDAPALAARILRDPAGTPSTQGIADFDPARYLRRKGLRHLSRTSQLACAAAARLADDLGDVPPGEVGVVLGSAWASLDSIVRFERAAHVEGPRFVDPGLFAETVANVPAGHVSIFFGWSALNLTIASGAASGLQAIVTALALLEEGRAAAVAAGGADELNAHVLRVRAGRGLVGGEAACVLLIESAKHAAARKARPWGRIRGAAAGWADPGSKAWIDERARLLGGLFERSGLRPHDIDLVILSRNASPSDLAVFEGRRLPVLSPAELLGETWAAAAPLGVVLALESIWQQAGLREAIVIDVSDSGHHGAILVAAAD